MQQQSQLGLISMLLGIGGLLMTFMGCGFFPVLMIATILSGVAVYMGFAEKKKIAAGEVGPEGAAMATVGQIMGGTGCAIQLLSMLALLAFVVLYFVAIVLTVGLGVLSNL